MHDRVAVRVGPHAERPGATRLFRLAESPDATALARDILDDVALRTCPGSDRQTGREGMAVAPPRESERGGRGHHARPNQEIRAERCTIGIASACQADRGGYHRLWFPPASPPSRSQPPLPCDREASPRPGPSAGCPLEAQPHIPSRSTTSAGESTHEATCRRPPAPALVHPRPCSGGRLGWVGTADDRDGEPGRPDPARRDRACRPRRAPGWGADPDPQRPRGRSRSSSFRTAIPATASS